MECLLLVFLHIKMICRNDIRDRNNKIVDCTIRTMLMKYVISLIWSRLNFPSRFKLDFREKVQGREWTLDFNIASVRQIRARSKTVETLKNVDFLDCAALLTSLNDVFFAADLLFVCCESQADEQGITSEDFGKALKVALLFNAITEMTAEYLDFFPDPTTVEKMKIVVEKSRATQEALANVVCAKAGDICDEILTDAAMKLGALYFEKSPTQAETTEDLQV